MSMKKETLRFTYQHWGAKKIKLHLYEEDEKLKELELSQSIGTSSLFEIELPKDEILNKDYLLEVDGAFIIDPRAQRISGERNFGENFLIPKHKGRFTLEVTERQERLNIPTEDIVSMQLHIRGFSQLFSKEWGGTFLGLGKRIDYLKSLGINQVIVLPMYEFEEAIISKDRMATSKVNYWGFGEGYYFAPKQTFSKGKDALSEAKEMIELLHFNGIEVIMMMNFSYPIPLKLITEVLSFWRFQMGVDGFYLKGYQPLMEILTDATLGDFKLYVDYFDEAHLKIAKAKDIELVSTNDYFKWQSRHFLKGDISSFELMNIFTRKDEKRLGLHYICDHNGMNLEDLVSYGKKHNEANGEDNRDGLYDDLSQNFGVEGPTKSRKILEKRHQHKRNALILTLLSRGIPMIFAGDECGHSQAGNNNPYCQDNEINYLNPDLLKRRKKEIGFVKQLVEFRRKHPILTKKVGYQTKDILGYGFPEISFHSTHAWKVDSEDDCLGILYHSRYLNQEKELIYIIFNPSNEEREVALLKSMYGSWEVVLDSSRSFEKAFDREKIDYQSQIKVKPKTIMILESKEIK